MRPLLLLYCLLAMGCTHGEFAGVEGAGTTAADTSYVRAGAIIGKVKARTVIIQNGTGNVATPTDNTKAGQKDGEAATAPQAQASATTTLGGLPWWVFALVGMGSIVAWEWLASRFVPAAWLPWRARPG